MAQRLILFTRLPVAGATKTRLIPALGPRGAALLHRIMARHTLDCATRFARQHSIEIEVRVASTAKAKTQPSRSPATGAFTLSRVPPDAAVR